MIPTTTAALGRQSMLLLCCALACEPTSATDKEAHREELRRTLDINRFWGEYEFMNREADRKFAERFKGQIQPGMGCQACPALCTIADLRPIDVPEFKQRFRQAANHAARSDAHYIEILLAIKEIERLGCIAASGGEPLRRALSELMDPAETRATRDHAARQAEALSSPTAGQEHPADSKGHPR